MDPFTPFYMLSVITCEFLILHLDSVFVDLVCTHLLVDVLSVHFYQNNLSVLLWETRPLCGTVRSPFLSGLQFFTLLE